MAKEAAAKKRKNQTRKPPKKAKKQSLLRVHDVNLLVALLYVGQLVLMIALFVYGELAIADRNWPVDLPFLGENALTGSQAPATKNVYDIQPIYLLPIILVLAAWPLLAFSWRSRFYREVVLKRQVNVWRWLSSGLVFGLMAVMTATALGVANLGYLLLLFASMLAFAWLALATEFVRSAILSSADGKSMSAAKLLPAVTSFNLVAKLQALVVVFPWAVLFLSLAGARILGSQVAIGWMHYLLFLVAFLPVLLWHFGALARWRNANKKWQDYLFVEKFYVLSQFVFLSGWIWLMVLGGF